MPESKTSLNDILYDIRRIEENREILSEKKIKAIYQQLIKDIDAFLAEGYKKYADNDGKLYLAYLDGQRERAKFLREIVENVDNISKDLKKEVTTLIDETYNNCYDGMIIALQEADKQGRYAAVVGDLDVQPDVLNQTINNNIERLTLPSVLDKHRSEIVYQIQQTITIGLLNGDRYEQMARRIAERANVSYSKAMNIVRTETHRNVEGGFMDCAENIQESLDGSDLIYAATWQTAKDERVRPQQRRKTKSGWKTNFSKNGANHMKMQGVTVKAGDFFDLGGGVKTKAPGKSGVASHDCRCRCWLEYNLMTIDEFKTATGRNVTVASLSKKIRQQMDDKGVPNLGLERTTNSDRFDTAIKSMKKADKTGAAACVDIHPLNELDDFKMFLSWDGMAGVAVKPDGDITAVFKNCNSSTKGAVNDLIITARANGGEKMDCYGRFLVNSYERCGYVPVARVPFNAEYVSDKFLLDNPMDVYVMMKNTDDIKTVIKKNGEKLYNVSTQEKLDNLRTFEDYDEALRYRDELLKNQTKK